MNNTFWKRRFAGTGEPAQEPAGDGDGCGIFCASCGNELRYDEVYGECGRRAVCSECLEDEWRELDAHEKFEKLGYDPVRQVRRGTV